MTQMFQQNLHWVVIGVSLLVVGGLVLTWVNTGVRQTMSTFGLLLGWTGVVLMAGYPWIIHVVGVNIHELNTPVSNILEMPDSTLRGMLTMAGIGMIFALVTGFAAWISTRVSSIILNIVGNFASSLWLVANAAKQLGAGKLLYYQLYAAEIAVVATIVVTIMGVFGAWNKNPTQIESRST